MDELQRVRGAQAQLVGVGPRDARGGDTEVRGPLARAVGALGRPHRGGVGTLAVTAQLQVPRRLAVVAHDAGKGEVQFRALVRIEQIDHHLGQQGVPNGDAGGVGHDEVGLEQALDAGLVQFREAHRTPGERQHRERLAADRVELAQPGGDGQAQAGRGLARDGQLAQQQRVAAGAVDDAPHGAGTEVGTQQAHHGTGVVETQGRQPDLREPGRAQPVEDGLGGSVPAADAGQQPDPAGQQRRHLDRGGVGPLQVVEEQHPAADPLLDGCGDRGRVTLAHRGAQGAFERQVLHPRQRCQPAALEHRTPARRRALTQQRGLADARLADDDGRTVVGEQPGELGQRTVPAHDVSKHA